MAAKLKLFDCENEKSWQKAFKFYPKVLKLKAEKKTKPQAKKELVVLDNWYQNELPKFIQDRSRMHITLEELEKLMKWKLSRGKFRPMLPKLIASNKPADVINASTQAFEKLPDLKESIKALSVLKGVGPATASAVLAAGSPAHVPFMADESVAAVPEISTIKYDLNCYMQFADAIKRKQAWLQKINPDGEWTAHKVELAVWTDVMARTLDPSLLESVYSDETEGSATGQSEETNGGDTEEGSTESNTEVATGGSKKRRSQSAGGGRDSKTKKSKSDTNGH